MQVRKYIPQYKWYYVEYEDDDNEELVEADLLLLLNQPQRKNDASHKEGQNLSLSCS